MLDIDEERRRISLGIKQTLPNPWEEFAQNYQKGDRVHGQIKSITDFGIFVGLEGGIDGLVHLSDLSWNEAGEDVMRRYEKGQEMDAAVLAIDPERERISLGVKQLEQDPLSAFLATHNKGDNVKGTITEVDAKGAFVTLENETLGYVRASEIARDRVEDARQALSEGDEIEAQFIGVDRKNRTVNLSIKGREFKEERETVKEYAGSGAAGTTRLGDLLREQMDSSRDDS